MSEVARSTSSVAGVARVHDAPGDRPARMLLLWAWVFRRDTHQRRPVRLYAGRERAGAAFLRIEPIPRQIFGKLQEVSRTGCTLH